MCGNCCCGPNGQEEGHGHKRRLLTKAEKIEKLTKYAETLKKELTAVEEHIQELNN